jgi:hypothetical protein
MVSLCLFVDRRREYFYYRGRAKRDYLLSHFRTVCNINPVLW